MIWNRDVKDPARTPADSRDDQGQIWQVLMSHQMSRERERSGVVGLDALGRGSCCSGQAWVVYW